MKQPLGSKITRDKTIENQIIVWIQTEPKISNYEISKRLLEKFNEKVSQPTIKKWRTNYFQNSEKEFNKKKIEISSLDSQDIEIKYEQIKNLMMLLDNLHERKDIIKTVLDSKNEMKDGVLRYRIDTFIETIYKDYINSIINLEDKILKYTSGSNPFTIAREVLMSITEFVAILFVQYNISKEDMDRFKDFLKEKENEYYLKYNIDKKIRNG